MWKSRVFCLMVMATLVACSKRSDDRDDGGKNPPAPGREVSIAYLKSLYSGYPFRITDDYVIKGTVVSTDRYGNYYKTMAIQDGTAGIEIRIDSEQLFLTFHVGDIVQVHCNALTLGAYGGLAQLGTAPTATYQVGYIDEETLSAHLSVVGAEPSSPAASVITIGEVEASSDKLSCLVRFTGVQFASDEIGLCWCDEGDDTDRTLIDSKGNELKVRTSHRSEFALWQLPAGNGYIEGILSYFNDSYQLRVVDPRQISMRGERF